MPLEVRSLAADEGRAAAELLTDAFVDDPFWRSIGPRRHGHRRLLALAANRLELAHALRSPHAPLAASRDGKLAGVAIANASDGTEPDSPAIWGMAAAGAVLAIAGPLALWRSQSASWTVAAARPARPHTYLDVLAVAPAQQRTGVGTALLEAVLAQSGSLDVHLETMRRENIAYYQRFGFELTGERRLPRGFETWLMLRRARA